MAYQQEISRHNKGLFVFLLDQSYSMEEPLSGSDERKMDYLATVINGWLQNMCIRCTGNEGIRDYWDVALIGYRTDMEANPLIESPLDGPLAGQILASIRDIGENPSRMEQRMQQYFDEESGDLVPMPVDMPIWVTARAEGPPVTGPVAFALGKPDGMRLAVSAFQEHVRRQLQISKCVRGRHTHIRSGMET